MCFSKKFYFALNQPSKVLKYFLPIGLTLIAIQAFSQTENKQLPARYYRSLGIVNFYEHNFLAAAKALQQSLQINPLDKEANEMLKTVYDSIGTKQLSQKMKVRSQAINLSFKKGADADLPSVKNDLRSLGNDYYNRSVYDSAITAYKLHLQNNAQDTSALFYLANSYFFLRNFNDATKYYESLLALDKERADVYNLAGVCYQNIDDIMKARDYFKQCLILNQDFSVAYYNLGKAQYILEDFKQAESNLVRASEVLPNDKDVLSLLGKLYIETGQREKALNVYERQFALNRNSTTPNVVLGQLYYENSDFEKSIFHLNNALVTVKDNIELQNILGNAYLKLKKYEIAFQLLKQVADVLIERKEVQTATANAANNFKHYKEAKEYANRALALDKDYKPALQELVISLKGLKKNSDAKKVQKQLKGN